MPQKLSSSRYAGIALLLGCAAMLLLSHEVIAQPATTAEAEAMAFANLNNKSCSIAPSKR